MTGRSRANGEGSLFTYRNGYAAYVWVTTPVGNRERKWIYGQDRNELHGRWIDLQKQARGGPIATKVPKLAEYIAYWLQEIVAPNLAPLTYATYAAAGPAARSAARPGPASERSGRRPRLTRERKLLTARAHDVTLRACS